MKAYAHSGNRSDRCDWQLLDDHLANVAQLAAKTAKPLKLSTISYIAGSFHDFGKYNPEFDKVLAGQQIRVDHSTAGGRHLIDYAKDISQKLTALILAHSILGHHAGLPNTYDDSNSNLEWRIKSHQENQIPAFGKKIEKLMANAPGDLLAAAHEVKSKIRPPADGIFPGFEMSVVGRMVFSCLVDSDFRDTELFYEKLNGSRPKRIQSDLHKNLKSLIESFEEHMEKLISSAKQSKINLNRHKTLKHIRKNACKEPGLFTLSVPTGGGKTLASLGFALDHAKHHGHRRIIYAIPYTSIIEQTASIFRDLFGDDDVVLEHHSSIDEDLNLETTNKLRLAMEDWSRPIIVTTNVQLFESLFSSKPSKCRKIHNIAGSIIILDEAQCLPRHLLIPILSMLEILTAHYGCSVVFCTATQPAFDSRQLNFGGLKLEGRELAPEPEKSAKNMQRATIRNVGCMEDKDLILDLTKQKQGVVIVNTRKHALDLYELGKENDLQGLIHLSTRQHAHDRRIILNGIRDRLKSGKPCRLIATSLIEAGVDLDFPVGWRAETGLDSIMQAAGRVNREGKSPPEKSILKVFRCTEDQNLPSEIESYSKATRRVLRKHDNRVSPEAVRDWFEEVYWQLNAQSMGQDLVENFKFGNDSVDFPYRLISSEFELIQNYLVPIIISQNTQTSELLSDPKIKSFELGRQLQPYIVQVPKRIRDVMVANGHATFASPNLRGTQFCLLINSSLYTFETGLLWDELEYIGSGII